MTTNPPPDPAAEDAIRTQVERLIIENRNSLNDPTTNEPFDIQGIADDVVALILEARIEADRAKDNAYWERDQLVAVLSKLYPAWLGYHVGEDWEDDWRTIVYIKLPRGQVSWHIHDSEKPYFKHLNIGLEKWDGHTTYEKYKRLAELKRLSGYDD